ncbi:MAG: haloacid dehalogenase type II [Rhodospirillales bacterium]
MSNAVLAAVSACVFDAYGTLFDVNAAADKLRHRIGPQADRLAEQWRTRQLQYSWLRSISGKHADFWQLTGDALDVSLATLGIKDAALRADLMDLYYKLSPYADAQGLLARLRQAGKRTAILSNGSKAMLKAAVDASGFAQELDAVLSIDDVGVFKPHGSVYRLAETALGLPAKEMCFVSSNAWDAHASADFGFRSVWVNRAGAPREKLPGELAAEIRSLGELPALLGL